MTTLEDSTKKHLQRLGKRQAIKLINTEEGGFMQVDLRKYAQKQLLSEKYSKINIDVSIYAPLNPKMISFLEKSQNH